MFELLEHTADFGLRASGNSWQEAFQEAAKGMFSVMTDLAKIEKKQEFNVSVKAPKIDELFIEWLNELLFLTYTERVLFSDFKIGLFEEKNGEWQLQGKAFGEKMDEKKHELIRDVKAATYSGLKAEEKSGKFVVQCVLDV